MLCVFCNLADHASPAAYRLYIRPCFSSCVCRLTRTLSLMHAHVLGCLRAHLHTYTGYVVACEDGVPKDVTTRYLTNTLAVTRLRDVPWWAATQQELQQNPIGRFVFLCVLVCMCLDVCMCVCVCLCLCVCVCAARACVCTCVHLNLKQVVCIRASRHSKVVVLPRC